MNPQPKNKPFRSKKTREWFRGKPCEVCGNEETTGHHEPLNGRGMGSKGPDDEQVPLCFFCHRTRHNIGRESFWKLYAENWSIPVLKWKNKLHTENPGWDDK